VKRVAIIALALAFAPPARAGGEYARDRRVAYLGRALSALRSLGAGGRSALEEELHAGARRRCRADRRPPSVPCLLELADATCDARPAEARAPCHLAADVVLTNQLSENELVDEATRNRLVAGSYRDGMRAALAARRRALAADMVLSPAGRGEDVAGRIDRFCASGSDLAWQRCAAALLWYVAEQP
jgi:hypothetical protein